MPSKEDNERLYGHKTIHSFTRRDSQHDYHAGHKAYMLTLTVEDDAPLFGEVIGHTCHFDPQAPLHECPSEYPSTWSKDTAAPAPAAPAPAAPYLGPRVRLTLLGEAILQSWLLMKERYAPLIDLREDEFVVMPEHFHGLIYMSQYSEKHLSDFEKAFKGCCHTAYRLLLAQGKTQPVGTAKQWLAAYMVAPEEQRRAMDRWLQAAYERSHSYQYSSTRSKNTPQEAPPAAPPMPADPSGPPMPTAPSGTPMPPCPSSADISAPPIRISIPGSASKVGFLFRINYTDKHASSEVKAEEKRQYIHNNPRTRALRHEHRDWQSVKKEVIDTDLTLKGLESYLHQAVGPFYDQEQMQEISSQLLLQYSSTRSKNTIRCDSYGSLELLQQTLLPVVCHRSDRARFQEQKQRLLDWAAQGAVLISARIAKGEQEIMDEAASLGYPVVRLMLEGFKEKYHPSTELNDICAAGKLTLLSPWQWHYAYAGETINPMMCKTLNCIVQSICRRNDNFWKYLPPVLPPPSSSPATA